MWLGPSAYICDECIAICNNIIEDENYEDELGYEEIKSENIPTPQEIKNIEVEKVFAKLGLGEHLSPSRRNGMMSMVEKIRFYAAHVEK